MTVVALGRHQDGTVLIADGIGTRTDVRENDERYHPLADKLVEVSSDTFAAILGESDLKWALHCMVTWDKAHGLRTDLSNRVTISNLCELALAWRLAQQEDRKRDNRPIPWNVSHTVVHVVDNQSAYLWELRPDGPWLRPADYRKQVAPGTFRINYGGKLRPATKFTCGLDDAVEFAWTRIEALHSQRELQGRGLGYSLDGRYSATVLPHQGEPKRWLPYSNPGEMMAGYFGLLSLTQPSKHPWNLAW